MNINCIPGLSPRALEQTLPRGVERTRGAIESLHSIADYREPFETRSLLQRRNETVSFLFVSERRDDVRAQKSRDE